jgi:excisionase family DNA binding protein
MRITTKDELSTETITEDSAQAKEATGEAEDYCVGCGREFRIYASSFVTEDGEWVCPFCFYEPANGWKLDPRWHTDPEFFGVVYQPHAQPNAETLTEAEAAKLIGVSKVTLQRARKRGDVACYRIGARVLYSKKHIEAYLAAVEQGKRSDAI